MREWITICLVSLLLHPITAQLCDVVCDGDDSHGLNNPREVLREVLFGRNIAVYVSDADNAAFGRISNGDPTDEIWLDRSFDGGRSWNSGSQLGHTTIPDSSRETQTAAFNIDGSFPNREIGVVRACGSPGNLDDIACTQWTRGTKHASNPAEAATTALMMYYSDNGQWDTTGWWNAANCLTTVIDYMKVTGDRTYLYVLDNTFEKNKNQFYGNFCNDYIDDTGWWGLAWLGAYDITGEQKYLDTAKTTCDYMYTFRDDRCNGGVYWSEARSYKNAITNELFIKLAAGLHNRINGDSKYLNWATEIYNWLNNSGMINNDNLINDGLNTVDNCDNNNGVTWTYNQGVILGGLAELYKGTNNSTYLDRGRSIADAVVNSDYLSPNGVLHEPCDNNGNDCGGDGKSFKGAFARNIGEINEILPGKPYSDYIRNNAEVIHNSRNSVDQYGLHYEGPLEFQNAATQHSATEMLTAAERLNRI